MLTFAPAAAGARAVGRSASRGRRAVRARASLLRGALRRATRRTAGAALAGVLPHRPVGRGDRALGRPRAAIASWAIGSGRARRSRSSRASSGAPGEARRPRLRPRQAVALLEQLPPGRELAPAMSTASSWGGRRTSRPCARRRARRRRRSSAIRAISLLGLRERSRNFRRARATLRARSGTREACSSSPEPSQTRSSCAIGDVGARRYDLAARSFDQGLTYCRTHGLELYRSIARISRAVRARRGPLGRCSRGRARARTASRASIILARRAQRARPRARATGRSRGPAAARGGAGARRADARATAHRTCCGGGSGSCLAQRRPAGSREATDDALAWPSRCRSAHDIACSRPGDGEPASKSRRKRRRWAVRARARRRRRGAAALWETRLPVRGCSRACSTRTTRSSCAARLDELQRLGARAPAAIVARRLRALGARDIRRGPRPTTRRNAARAHSSREPGPRTRRRGSSQCGDRGTPLPLAADGRQPRVSNPPQARRRHARRGRSQAATLGLLQDR